MRHMLSAQVVLDVDQPPVKAPRDRHRGQLPRGLRCGLRAAEELEAGFRARVPLGDERAEHLHARYMSHYVTL
jgi:hypothetical protein